MLLRTEAANLGWTGGKAGCQVRPSPGNQAECRTARFKGLRSSQRLAGGLPSVPVGMVVTRAV